MSYRTSETASPLVHVALGNHLLALARLTGERVWHQELRSHQTLRIVTDGDRVFALGRELACFAADTGAALWSVDVSLYGTLVVDQDLVFIGGAGELQCYAADSGRLLWSDGFKGLGVSGLAIAVPGHAEQADLRG